MQKKRIMMIFGTRPETIKMAPVIFKLKEHPDIFEPIIVVTAQHRQMLDQALKPFDIKPDYDLSIMEENQTLGDIITRSMQGFENIMRSERPDMILVQGDTTTTFTGALAAFNHKIPVGHIEAGLRTHNKFNPYPEEMNRKLTTALADIHFAPTQRAVESLLEEGVLRHSIYLTGNTVIDALLFAVKKPYDLKKAGVDIKKNKKIILVTTHRRESFGEPMRNVCDAVAAIAKKHGEIATIVLPVHKNPRVREVINDTLSGIHDIVLIEPMDYIPFVSLMKESYIILTDSGGVQEEAPSLGKPVLVLRDITERPEAVEAGTVKVVGTDTATIIRETERLLTNKEEYDKIAKAVNPYGDGTAADRIVFAIMRKFGYTDKRVEEFDPSKTSAKIL